MGNLPFSVFEAAISCPRGRDDARRAVYSKAVGSHPPPGVDHRVQLNPPELNPRGPRLPPGGGRPYLLLATRSSPTRLAAGVRGPPFGAAHRPSRLLFPVSPLSALSLATARRLRSVAGKTMLSTHPQSIHIRQPAVGIPVGLKVN